MPGLMAGFDGMFGDHSERRKEVWSTPDKSITVDYDTWHREYTLYVLGQYYGSYRRKADAIRDAEAQVEHVAELKAMATGRGWRTF